MIDPLETVLVYLMADATLATLVGSRIAAKHRYGDDWLTSQVGLAVRYDGGIVELDVPLQRVRLEARVYAPTQTAASAVWRRLSDITRLTWREKVTTSAGVALLHCLKPLSGPSLLYDSDVGLDLLLCFLEAQVGEGAAA